MDCGVLRSKYGSMMMALIPSRLTLLMRPSVCEPDGGSRVQAVVRVAYAVHVSHRPVHLKARPIEDLLPLRDVEVAGRTGTDVAVAALVEQRRQPSVLQLRASHCEQVGVIQQQQE